MKNNQQISIVGTYLHPKDNFAKVITQNVKVFYHPKKSYAESRTVRLSLFICGRTPQLGKAQHLVVVLVLYFLKKRSFQLLILIFFCGKSHYEGLSMKMETFRGGQKSRGPPRKLEIFMDNPLKWPEFWLFTRKKKIISVPI